MSYNVFISYSRQDSDKVDAIKQAFADRGLTCWVDTHSIEAGRHYAAEVMAQLNQRVDRPVMVLVISESSIKSPEVEKEFLHAEGQKLKILPARIDDAVFADSQIGQVLAYHVQNKQIVDLHIDFEGGIDRLAQAVRGDFAERGRVLPQPKFLRRLFRPKRRLPQAESKIRQIWRRLVRLFWIGVTAGLVTASLIFGPSMIAWLGAETNSLVTRFDLGIGANLLAREIEGAPSYQRLDTLKTGQPDLPSNLSANAIARLIALFDDYDRLQALTILAPNMARNYSVGDLVLLLSGLKSRRAQGIAVVWPTLGKGLDGAGVAMILGDVAGADRLRALDFLVTKLDRPASVNEAAAILNLTESYRATALQSLRNRLSNPINGDEALQLIGDLEGDRRLEALKTLVPILAPGLKVANANQMIGRIDYQRHVALRLLSAALSSDLTARDLQDLLGSTVNNQRAEAIQILAPKLNGPQPVTDILLLIEGTGNSRLASLTALKPFLPLPLDAADEQRLLGDLFGNDRAKAQAMLAAP